MHQMSGFLGVILKISLSPIGCLDDLRLHNILALVLFLLQQELLSFLRMTLPVVSVRVWHRSACRRIRHLSSEDNACQELLWGGQPSRWTTEGRQWYEGPYDGFEAIQCAALPGWKILQAESTWRRVSRLYLPPFGGIWQSLCYPGVDTENSIQISCHDGDSLGEQDKITHARASVDKLNPFRTRQFVVPKVRVV